MTDDAELLRRYAEERSEEAFAEIVRRHLGLVYHAALRKCGGDAHRAQDVAQLVFTDVARKAAQLARRPVLAGWLYTSTRYAAAQAVRTEARRQAREQDAHVMSELSAGGESPADWEQLQPVIDDALSALPERDREAVLLRFFEGRAFGEMSTVLAVSEDAARMRVERALEKMRAVLARHGIRSTTGALAVALGGQAGAAVPGGVAAAVTSASLTGAATVAASGGLAVLAESLLMGKLQSGIVAAMAIAGVSWFVIEARLTAALNTEVDALRANGLALREPRAENKRLVAAAVAAAPSSEARAELAQLQRRAAELGAQLRPPGRNGPQGKSRAEARLEGRSSPYRALQSVVAAVFSGNDYTTIAEAICFDEAAQVKWQAFFAGLPKAAQAKWGTPEELAARVFVDWLWQGDPPRRYGETMREIPIGADAMVEVRMTHWSGRTVEAERFPFKRFDDGWRYGPIPVTGVDAMIALIDPATGEPRPQPTTTVPTRRP